MYKLWTMALLLLTGGGAHEPASTKLSVFRQDLLQQTAYYRTPATLSAKTDDLDIAPPSAKKHIDWYIGHSWNWHTRESQQPSSYAGGGSCLQAAHPRLVPTCSQQ